MGYVCCVAALGLCRALEWLLPTVDRRPSSPLPLFGSSEEGQRGGFFEDVSVRRGKCSCASSYSQWIATEPLDVLAWPKLGSKGLFKK